MSLNLALVLYASFLFLGGLGQIVGIAYTSRLIPEDKVTLGWRVFFLWTSGLMITSGIALFFLDLGDVV